jgi:hypothetical protein
MIMPAFKVKLVEILKLGSEIAGVIDLDQKDWPQPGQYLSCQRVGDETAVLPMHMFSMPGAVDQLSVGPIPAAWQPGDALICTPPQGHGFHLPGYARRVGLLPFAVAPTVVLSLVSQAFSQGAMVCLFCDEALPGDMLGLVPAQVEVLPLTELRKNPAWPDYLAIDLERLAMERFDDIWPLANLKCAGEVLVRTAMPCRGLGSCGVCAVRTRKGWRLVCVDGPVFPIEEVFDVAR